MQNKSNFDVNVEENYTTSRNDPPSENFSIENAPIFSMKNDLELINNPKVLHQKSAPLPISSKPPHTSSPKINPFPTINNPFLGTTDSTPASSDSQKKPTPVLSPNKQLLKKEASNSLEKFDLKKVFVFSTILLSLIALGIGSYYFWLVRGEKPEVISEEPETIPSIPTPIKEPPLPTAIVEPAIKTEEAKENTLVLDLENSDLVKIKIALKNQIEKLPKDLSGKPIEFKLRDSQNNLINFSSFAKKSGLLFSQNLSAYLGESFSLFAFNDGPNLGTGLIVESKNDLILAQELLKEEPYLPNNLNVLFLFDVPQKTKSTSFSNFVYKDITLRFFNLISQEELSIDYAVAKNKLIIGTTRNTFTALYNWLLLTLEKK
jgi:hypothetical protein